MPHTPAPYDAPLFALEAVENPDLHTDTLPGMEYLQP